MVCYNEAQWFGNGFVVELSARTIPREPSENLKVGFFSRKFRSN